MPSGQSHVLLALLVWPLALLTNAHAQTYPAKPIRYHYCPGKREGGSLKAMNNKGF